MKARILAAAVLIPTAAFGATDTGLHYNNITIQHLSIDFDEPVPDADGFAFSFSRLASENVFITGSFASIETDTIHIGAASGTVEETDLSLSVGGRTPIADHADFVGSVGFVRADADATGDLILLTDDSDTGLTASAGIRAMATPMLELQGALHYVDINDESSTGFSAAALAYLSQQVALGFGYSSGDDSSSYTVGVRFSY